MKKPIIAGNWKMYKDVAAAVRFVKELRLLAKDVLDVEVVVAPAFTALHAAAEAARNSPVAIAAQDMYWEGEGAFTGEVSGPMVREAGAEYVIIGHSERRTLFGETDEAVNRKVVAAFAAGLTPIACIGETLAQRDAGETFAVLDRQLAEGLKGLSADQVGQLVLAYEPVWAIGTGRTATPAQAAEAHARIRGRLRTQYGDQAAALCHVIYGGSVKPDNIDDLIGQVEVDGALVGGASLEVDGFFQLVLRCRGGAV
jgi:triosephosphate isomerase (TIM)